MIWFRAIFFLFFVELFGKQIIQGKVYHGDEAVKGAIIYSPFEHKNTFSNDSGFYSIELENLKKIKIICKTDLKSQDSIEATITPIKPNTKIGQTVPYDFRFINPRQIDPKRRKIDFFTKYLPRNSDSLLLSAILKNNRQEIIKLLNNDFSPNVKTNKKQTALMLATLRCDTQIVKQLIEHGAKINKKDSYGQNALFFAIKQNNQDIIELLLSKDIEYDIKDNYNENPLFYAIRFNNLKLVKWLLDHDIEIDLTNRNQETPLLLAAKLNNIEIFENILAHRKQIYIFDKFDNSVLDYININKQTELIAKTINRATELDQLNKLLYNSVKFNQIEILQSILQHKPNLEHKNRKNHISSSDLVNIFMTLNAAKQSDEILKEAVKALADMNLNIQLFTTLIHSEEFIKKIDAKFIKNIIVSTANSNNQDIFDLIMDLAKRSNDPTLMVAALNRGTLPLIKAFHQNLGFPLQGDNFNPYYEVSKSYRNPIEIFQYLDENKVKYPQIGWPEILHETCIRGNDDAAIFILQQGIDLNQTLNQSPNYKNSTYYINQSLYQLVIKSQRDKVIKEMNKIMDKKNDK